MARDRPGVEKPTNEMIAVITSTICPENFSSDGTVRNVIPTQDRMEQTLAAINSLVQFGFTGIFLLDNSGDNWNPTYDAHFSHVTLIKANTYQFANKGINEVLLLLQSLKHLPDNVPLLKISGRYHLLWDVKPEIEGYDLAIRYFRTPGGRFTMHTSCYLIKNKRVFETLLRSSLEEHYADYARVKNRQALKRFARNNFIKKGASYSDPPLPIEFAFASALRICNLKYNSIPRNICEGIAGANPNTIHLH